MSHIVNSDTEKYSSRSIVRGWHFIRLLRKYSVSGWEISKDERYQCGVC
jgi:hypothetical protein